MACYEIIIGSGFFECYRYIIRAEYPTTDYGALTDMLIDYLVENKSNSILDLSDYDDYYFDDDGAIYLTKEEDDEYEVIYPDTFIQGGNHGDILIHHGEFRINEINEDAVDNDVDVVIEV